MLTSDGKVQAISLQEQPVYGCNVELTTLSAKQQSRWTLGLEAFGTSAEATEAQLKLIAEHIFTETYLDTLKEKNSYSYPRWLQAVVLQKI
jgi:hypothetical protein